MIDAALDVENTANFFGQNNSRLISCVLAPNPDTAHLFINGADTSNNWGTLTRREGQAPSRRHQLRHRP